MAQLWGMQMNVEEEIKAVSSELEDLRKRLPAHSLKPSMWEQVEELEERLEYLRGLSGMKEGGR